MEATVNSIISKKKTPKSTFHGPTGGFFSQKKKVVLDNIKHSSDERDISLSKFGSGDSVYSNVESLSGEDKNVSMFGANGESLLGSAATTPKTKSGLIQRLLRLLWKYQLKGYFALNINFSAMERKLAMAKTQLIRKFFSTVNGFGRATTSSKFEGIIQSTFTSEKSMKIATSLAREKKININSNLKRQRVRLDRAVVIKKILINMLKKIIIAALAEFAVVEFAKLSQAEHLAAKWSFLIGKNSVDQFRTLLFTLSVGMTAHDLSTLLEGICYAVVGFESEDAMESAYCTEPIFSSVKLSWSRLDLIHCEKCGLLGYSALECNASFLPITKPLKIVKKITSEDCCLQLAKLYAKKSVPISRPTVFGGKSWTQVVSLASPSGDFYFNSGTRSDFFLLVFQVLRETRWFFVFLVPITQIVPLATPVLILASLDTDMVLDVPWPFLPPSSSVLKDKMADLGLNSSKVFTSKVGGLESKMMALEVSIGSILGELDLLYINSGSLMHFLHQ
ncbi:hypothetical protein G9A89_013379 [Geosiphon pyriformis]|nr:hypothetical protein G9A89_013379 [Geosiphon pyriformis]